MGCCSWRGVIFALLRFLPGSHTHRNLRLAGCRPPWTQGRHSQCSAGSHSAECSEICHMANTNTNRVQKGRPCWAAPGQITGKRCKGSKNILFSRSAPQRFPSLRSIRFHGEDTVILGEQSFFKRMGNDDGRNATKPENSARHLIGSLGVQGCGRLIPSSTCDFLSRLRAMEMRCFSPPERPLPFSPQRNPHPFPQSERKGPKAGLPYCSLFREIPGTW